MIFLEKKVIKLTSPEKTFYNFLKENKIPFKSQPTNLPYKPDFLLHKYKLIININGCHWHNHGCANVKLPSKNFLFWINVFSKNKLRDYSNNQKLIEKGYKIISVWECVLMDKKARNDLYLNLNKLIKNLDDEQN